MNRKQKFFTLLEVIVALLIISIGVSGILWQLSESARRCSVNYSKWAETHELVQAAEYMLLCGPDAKPDDEFLSGDYRITFSYGNPELKTDTSVIPGKLQLRKLTLSLFGEGNRLLDELHIDTWYEAAAFNAKE